METLYSILGVSEDAKEGVIKKAYKKKATEYHPDKVNNLGEKLRIVAELEFKRLNKAKEVLLNEDKRREYNDLLRKRKGPGSGSSDEFAGADYTGAEARTEEEYRKDISALQAMVNSLNYENAMIKKNMNLERKNRIAYEKKLELLIGDRFWMKRDLETLINKFDEQIRVMDDQYRRILNQLLNDIFVEFQLSEDDFAEVQGRLMQIQQFSYQQLRSILGQYDNFESIRRNLADLNNRPDVMAEIREEADYGRLNDDTVETEEVIDVEWEFSPSKSMHELKKSKVKADLSKEGPMEECPYCGKEVDSEQTYCYYCGGVF